MNIKEYIEFIEKTRPPQTYYGSRFHRSYLRSLSVEDYATWCKYKEDKQRAYMRKWSRDNKHWVLKYRKKNKELYRRHSANWHKNNRPLVKEIRARSYRKHREDRIKKHREYYQKNKAKIKWYNKAYYIANWLKLKIKRIKGNKDNGTTTSGS